MTELLAIISKSMPNFSISSDTSFLNCAIRLSDFDLINLGGLIMLFIFYCLLPLSEMWLKPAKRGLFRFWHLFWIADRDVFCSSGLMCQNLHSAFETIYENEEEQEEGGLANLGLFSEPLERDKKSKWDESAKELIGSLYHNDATWTDVNYVRRELNRRLDELTELLLCDSNNGEIHGLEKGECESEEESKEKERELENLPTA